MATTVIKKIIRRMTWNFTPFSIVFQKDQDDGRVIVKDCVLWKSFMVKRFLCPVGI